MFVYFAPRASATSCHVMRINMRLCFFYVPSHRNHLHQSRLGKVGRTIGSKAFLDYLSLRVGDVLLVYMASRVMTEKRDSDGWILY